MQRVDLLVHGPHFYTMSGLGVGYMRSAAMVVDRGKIIAIGPQVEILPAFSAEDTLDTTGHAVFPGLIDAHIHTSHAVLRGLAQDTGNWMMHGIGPFVDIERASDEIMDAGSALAITEAIRSGTTTFGDYGTNMDGVCRILSRVGARGHITPLIREALVRIYAPGELYEYDVSLGRRFLEQNLALFDRWNGAANGLISIHMGPQGPDFVSEDLLLEIKRLALPRRMKIHMHVAQGDRETAQMMMRYGERPIAWLGKMGYLDRGLMAVHLTDATDDEAALVAKSGASMTLCSGAIGIIDGVVPPAKAFRDAGGNVALGSDQAPGNNCHNMLNEMKLTALFNKIRYADPEVMPAWQVLRMATIEGARAIGLGDQIGSLEEGKRADFVTVDLSKPTMAPLYTEPMRNIVPNLVYSARGNEVTTVVVDGKPVLMDGKISGVDEQQIIGENEKHARAIGQAGAERFWRINGTNARFMREDKL